MNVYGAKDYSNHMKLCYLSTSMCLVNVVDSVLPGYLLGFDDLIADQSSIR